MGDFYNLGFEGMFGFGWIFMVLFWGLVIWGIVALIRGAGYSDHAVRKDEDRSIAILNERYAKGEIPKKEYEEKKKSISN